MMQKQNVDATRCTLYFNTSSIVGLLKKKTVRLGLSWKENSCANELLARLVGAGGGQSTHHGSIPIGSNLVSHLLGVGVWDRVGQLI
jgi:hypothetical protein